MNGLKSPVNRIGGKSLLTGWLCRYVPGHVCYVEPFCGASHLLFGKQPSPVEILNDADSHLMTFFRVIQEPETRQMLMERLTFMPYSRALWQEIRTRWKQGAVPGDPVQSTAEWFYLNRSTFSGDQKRGGWAMPSVTGRNPAQSYFNAIDGLEGIAGRLRGVTIENLDYADCIRRYDSLDTLFYCDQPYYGHEHYYGDSFALEDHHALAKLLHDVKGKVMVSHYANGLYDELYQGWRRYESSSFKGSHKSEGEEKPKTIEVLYCNFKPVGQNRSLFEGMNL
ncbi:MAG TPA: DNA adenine methylase [Candidatus Brocadiaceae bacterium]|nr:DNA adenine methylase [Candidatus Brocadiaceae bacterium]